jgi:hypothetical protein
VAQVLREYSRYFIGADYADTFAQGLLALERNWQGPLAANAEVYTTLAQFQALERTAPPPVLLNWRFQQALYRAYYDAYTRARLLYEQSAEANALERLRDAASAGSLPAVQAAEEILDRAVTQRTAAGWRARVFELAEALFQSVHMQLSVPRYRAIDVGRGANLDTVDMPLNSRAWLKERFAEIRRLDNERERGAAIDAILNWTNPGPGGFYDDLGNLSQQPHLARGPGFHDDPAFLESSLVSCSYVANGRMSWWNLAETLNDTRLEMRYTNLDPKAQYKVRVIYAGDAMARKIRMEAGGIEVHPFLTKPAPIRPLEFDIPPQATARGELRLTWQREPQQGGNGRGCQVAEVWLMRK